MSKTDFRHEIRELMFTKSELPTIKESDVISKPWRLHSGENYLITQITIHIQLYMNKIGVFGIKSAVKSAEYC